VANKQFFKTLTLQLLLWDEEMRNKRKEVFPVGGKSSISGISYFIIANVLMIFNRLLQNPCGSEAVFKIGVETKKDQTLGDFLLQLTAQAFGHYEILPRKVSTHLLEISQKLLHSLRGTLSKMLPKVVEVMAEAFSDLEYQVSIHQHFTCPFFYMNVFFAAFL